jgi:hypothetical protein
MGKQIETLKDHADIHAQRAKLRRVVIHPMARDLDSPAINPLQAVQTPQKRALSGSASSDERQDLTVFDRDRYALEDVGGPEAFPDVLNFYDRHRSVLSRRRLTRDIG